MMVSDTGNGSLVIIRAGVFRIRRKVSTDAEVLRILSGSLSVTDGRLDITSSELIDGPEIAARRLSRNDGYLDAFRVPLVWFESMKLAFAESSYRIQK
jgi:hypothetical protein